MRPNGSAYLVLKNIPEREWSFSIAEHHSLLGRSHEAEIRIPERFRTVSRCHAELWTDHCGIWVRDLGSKLGTNVNGVWVDHVAQAGLAVGDRVWFGGVEADVVSAVEELAHVATDSGPDNMRTLVPAHTDETGRALAHRLSRAEIDVMLWLSRGYQTDDELAKFLHRSPHTVRTEIKNIFHKLNLHSRAAVMCWLRRTCPL